MFKCENRFDRSIEEMFNNFQSGVKIMSGSKNCFTGELLLVINNIVETGADAAVQGIFLVFSPLILCMFLRIGCV